MYFNMLNFRNYFKYHKLLQFNCYSNVCLKQRKFNVKSHFLVHLLNNNYFFYCNYYFFLFLVQKLRCIIKNIIFNKGKFVFLNELFDISFFLKKLICINNQFYFNFHKGLFSSIMLIKNFLKKNSKSFELLNYFFLYDFNINFVILFLNKNLNSNTLNSFRKLNVPVLYFFNNCEFSGDYHLSIHQNNRSVYFWVFLLLRLIWEENFYYLQHNLKIKLCPQSSQRNLNLKKISFLTKQC